MEWATISKTLLKFWAHGAVGSALPLQGRGHRFDSGCVHFLIFRNGYLHHPPHQQEQPRPCFCALTKLAIANQSEVVCAAKHSLITLLYYHVLTSVYIIPSYHPFTPCHQLPTARALQERAQNNDNIAASLWFLGPAGPERKKAPWWKKNIFQ